MDKSGSVTDGVSKEKHTVMETFIPPDLSPPLQHKLSAVSCDNATWHTNYKEPDASGTLCKIFSNSIPMSNSIVITY